MLEEQSTNRICESVGSEGLWGKVLIGGGVIYWLDGWSRMTFTRQEEKVRVSCVRVCAKWATVALQAHNLRWRGGKVGHSCPEVHKGARRGEWGTRRRARW